MASQALGEGGSSHPSSSEQGVKAAFPRGFAQVFPAVSLGGRGWSTALGTPLPIRKLLLGSAALLFLQKTPHSLALILHLSLILHSSLPFHVQPLTAPDYAK